MNTLKFYPKKIREEYEKNVKNSGLTTSPEKYNNKSLLISFIISALSSAAFYFLNINMLYSLGIFVFLAAFFYFRISLKAGARIKKMEQAFPDVISLMASNLRSGITIDRAFLLSARPEFTPLDEEILKTGKDIATGKGVDIALKNMSTRIDSEKISKIISLIVSGLKSGGNMSDLLEQTASNMKEKEFIEKRAASNILMYVIFIFFAIGIGAPVLFGLSSILVEMVVNLSEKIPEPAETQVNLPLTFSQISISPEFILYFAIVFIIVTDLISCLVIGLVNKGEGKTGLKYFIPLVLFSLLIFLIIRIVLLKFLAEAFLAI